MATYAVGDIQGCYLTLQKLLERIEFQPGKDRLWLCGDLVNRGPRSLEVLRWARETDSSLMAVLGNHDLHLLSRAGGFVGPKKRDTLEQVLKAPDREDLLQWLRLRPLFHREGNFALFHGGLAPEWTLPAAEGLAREAEAALRGEGFASALKAIESGKPTRWNPEARGMERIRDVFHIFTRVRLCRADGSFDFEFKGAPEDGPAGEFPWYEAPQRQADEATLLFGHWASLGLRVMERRIALDSGCVWKNRLSAVRLEDRAVFQESYCD